MSTPDNVSTAIYKREGWKRKVRSVESSDDQQPKDSTFRKIRKFHKRIMKASAQYKVDPALLYAVMSQESSEDSGTVLSQKNKEPMRFMENTGTELNGQNSLNSAESINGGARYLRELLDRFHGNIHAALAAYDAGPRTVERYGGIPPYQETLNYVDGVLDIYHEYKKAFSHGGGN